MRDLTSPDSYFEDFVVGQRIRHARGATVGEVENNFVTKQVMNTAQAHWNEHALAGADGHFDHSGRVVFGLVTASIVFGLASQDVAENAIAETGCTGLRFTSPVKQGDTLYAFTEVISATPSDRDDAGVIRFKHWGVTHDDRVVFEGERSVLIKRRAWRPRRNAQSTEPAEPLGE